MDEQMIRDLDLKTLNADPQTLQHIKNLMNLLEIKELEIQKLENEVANSNAAGPLFKKNATVLKDFDINKIDVDDETRQSIRKLMNLLEEQTLEIGRLSNNAIVLKNEVNRLKGEQGIPKIKGNKKKAKKDNHSSESERKEKKTETKNDIQSSKDGEKRGGPGSGRKRNKNENLKIHDVQICRVDKTTLPDDAKHNGYRDNTIQDIVFCPWNTLFRREIYYSESQNKIYVADLPDGYHGQFGPELKAWIITQYFSGNCSEGAIYDMLNDIEISISKGKISDILTKTHKEDLKQESSDLYKTALSLMDCHYIDDTGTRVNGINHYCQIICNSLYTMYFTTESKSRRSVLKALSGSNQLSFVINSETFDLLQVFKTSQKLKDQIKKLPEDKLLGEEEFTALLKETIPNLGPGQLGKILDSAAIAAYRLQTEFKVPTFLMADDAPQFKQIVDYLILCWIHEGRHFKKLTPHFTSHQEIVDNFLTEFWEYYHRLLEFNRNPDKNTALQLDEDFDKLFSQKTDYDLLNERIDKIRAKKNELLLSLRYPGLPLHNNPSELGARRRVRKRDASYQARSSDGIEAWDVHMSLLETTRKLGISFSHFINDRISKKRKIPPLNELIRKKVSELNPLKTKPFFNSIAPKLL